MKQPAIDFEVLSRVTTETRAYQAGEVIFKTGDVGTELFVIQQGTVAVRVGERVVETLGPGAVCGELALMERQARSATTIAETECVVVPVTEKQFLVLIRLAPNFALGLMRTLAQRLRTANTSLSAR